MNQGTTHKQIKNLVTAAMLLAAGIILPFFTGQIPQIGSMLLLRIDLRLALWWDRRFCAASAALYTIWDAADAKWDCNGV